MNDKVLISDLFKNRSFQIQLLILILIALSIYSICFFLGKVGFIDDAYISFRYARNLADGFGLAWNIGEAPTQGSTTLSFVVLIALGLKLGLSPELTAFLLNLLGNMLIIISLQTIYHLSFDKKYRWGIIPVLCVVIYGGSIELTSLGMESVFWTGLLYADLLILLSYMQTRKLSALAGFFVLAFLCCLTRPDSALFIGLWFLYLLWKLRGVERWRALLGIGLFGLAGAMYLAWLNSYYGYIFPNAFYIKAASGFQTAGLLYVLSFFAYFILMPISIIGFTGIIFFSQRKYYLPLPLFVFYSFLVFYLFTDPMMGVAFRFLHPVAVVSVFLCAQGCLFHFNLIWEKLSAFRLRQSEGVQRFILLMASLIAGGLFIVSFASYGFNLIWVQLSNSPFINKNPSDTGDLTRATALALAEIPEIQNIKIIYCDAGLVAYETMSYFIDPVGLNNTEIALNGRKFGVDWVIDYLFEQNADLIAFYGNRDGTIFEFGHGVIGGSYRQLYLDPRFQENFTEVAVVDYRWVLNRWFVNNNSPYLAEIRAALAKVNMENPPPLIP